jgi:hypothetical protein
MSRFTGAAALLQKPQQHIAQISRLLSKLTKHIKESCTRLAADKPEIGASR